MPILLMCEVLSVIFKSYNGKDLIRENLNFHRYRIQVQNTGNNIILKDQFDENDLWGVRVSSGTIVKTGQPASDSTYIKENIGIKMADQMTLRFTPIIFEPGDFFILDFFVLLSTSEPPSITSVGKIAGIKQIPVIISNLNRKSLFYEAYWGEWEVLLLRIIAGPVYILLFIACVAGVVWPVIFIRSRSRRRQVRKVLVNNGVDLENPAARAVA